MRHTITKDIINHLECLGFSLKSAEDAASDYLSCRHPHWNNLAIKVSSGSILITARWCFTPMRGRKFPSELFDEANRSAFVSRWYAEAETPEHGPGIIIETFAMEYGRESFGNLLMRFETEIRDLIPKFFKHSDEVEAAGDKPAEQVGFVIMSPSGNLNPAMHDRGDSDEIDTESAAYRNAQRFVDALNRTPRNEQR